MRSQSPRLLVLLLLLYTNKVAAADDNSEFAFNLFSDIAPIFALFGEQFTRQFLSQSLTWVDHIVFACVPLGIVTALTGAIRVQGPHFARSFIGRARENRATAEIELMSSTSKEVCEMFNGKGIIRTMGHPKIAQIIIFPDLYDQFRNDLEKPEPSCGIYTLEKASECENENSSTMISEAYHSKSYMAAVKLLKQIGEKFWFRKGPANETVPDPEKLTQPSSEGKCYSSFDFLVPPNLQLNVSSAACYRKKRGTELFVAAVIALVLQSALIVIAAVTVYHKPTRMLIGDQPKRYGLPFYVGGSVFLSIGMAICSCVIESSTTELIWKRTDIVGCSESLNSRVHRALAGIFYKIQGKSDTQEVQEDNSNKHDKCPRLIWLQQSQRVSDQFFESYAILGGSKRYVMTSHRQEVQRGEKSTMGENLLKSLRARLRAHHRERAGQLSNDEENEKYKKKISAVWGAFTLVGVCCGSLGFISQLIGLRGLSFPCSMSQIAATFLMALLRAYIRRRLGKIPSHCRALSGYELDFLATCIVFSTRFREFDHPRDDNECLRSFEPKNICQWEVITPHVKILNKSRPPCGSDRVHINNANTDKELASKGGTVTNITTDDSAKDRNGSSKMSDPDTASSRRQGTIWMRQTLSHKKRSYGTIGDKFEERPSQELVCVRERLGNLCKWNNSASAAALALAQSIETFMAKFPPENEPGPIKWVIETTKYSYNQGFIENNSVEADTVEILLKRDNTEGKKSWSVELGKIEAVLSLWLATIEADLIKTAERATENSNALPGDWRRSQAGIGTKVDYCRIIGDNYDDNVLLRDISWWVGKDIADQADVQNQYSEDTADGSGDPKTNKAASNQHGNEASETTPRRGVKKVERFIGFNGPIEARRKGKIPKELSVVSSGYLPTILAQHLFTSFMWTVAKKMPRDRLRQGERSTAGAVKVDPVNLYEFQKSWYHLKLSHSHLNAFVKYAEAAGLGSASEILLCMVPALSFNDLLPNEKMLSLMPLEFQHIQGYGWAQTASFYHDLLSLIVAEIEEYFALAAVVQAMEFVYFASEPFTKDIKPEPELDIALNKLVARLSGDFPNILKNLSPVYSLQGRRKSFEAVFHHYANYGECRVNKIEFPRWNSDENEEQKDFREKAGVTSVHIQVCDATKSNKSSDLPFNDVVKADIFGWTVVHYAATGSNQGVLEPVLKSARNNSQPIHRCLDKFKRSPIHVAALSTKESVLKKLLEEVKNMNGETVVSAAVNAKGLDGMTPIHLAAKGKHVGCLKTLLEHDRRTEVDVWGRHPIHLAAVAPLNLEIAKHLLDHGSQPDQLDTFERTPLTYLRHPREQEGVSNPGYSQKKMADELMRRWKRYDAKDCNGKAMLHYAIEFLDDSLDNRKIERYENFLKRGAAVDVADNNGCTPLHLAVLKKKEAEVDVLLRYGAKPSAENYRGETPLMLACQTGQARVFHSLLDKILDPQDKQAALDKKDNEGKTALHYVAACRLFSGGNLDRVVAAFEKNIDIRSQDGRTALHTAIIASNKSTALKLLDHGAKSGIAYKDGQVALHFVSRADKLDSDEAKDLINALIVAWEKEEIPQILSEKINARDDYGRTPLHEAILADNDIVAHALICLGADHAIKDSAGWTPLISAAAVGYCLEIVKLIVRNGNEEIVNQGDSYSDKSPIAYACEYGHLETVKCLLNALKVDPNRPATGKDNYTPLHLALGGKHVAVVNVLLDNPRVVPDWDGIGKTLLEHAKAEYYDCIEAILLHPRTPTAIRESIAKLGYSSTS